MYKYLHSRKYLIKDRQYICLGILQPDMLCPSASGKPAGNTGSVPAKRERAARAPSHHGQLSRGAMLPDCRNSLAVNGSHRTVS